MYMRGRKWNMRQPRRFPNLWRLLVLGLIAAFLYYVNQVVQPLSPSLFLPSPTPTLSPEVYISEAENLAAQGKYTQAIAEYQKAIKTDPQNPANYISSARLNAFSGNYAQAISDASNALLLAPNSSQAEAIKGFALGFSGEYLSAESSLKRAIELDPSNA